MLELVYSANFNTWERVFEIGFQLHFLFCCSNKNASEIVFELLSPMYQNLHFERLIPCMGIENPALLKGNPKIMGIETIKM